MKHKKAVVSLLVLLALAGFIASSVYTFYEAFHVLRESGKLPENLGDILNSSLTYVTAALTGLVGGIVAARMGVTELEPEPHMRSRFRGVGTVVSRTQNNRQSEVYGIAYTVAYIVIGVTSIIIWMILDKQVLPNVSNMAMTFLGMLIPIVSVFFGPQPTQQQQQQPSV